MVQMKLNKINIIDITAVVAVVLVVAIGATHYLRKPVPETTKLNVTIEVSDAAQVQTVADMAAKDKTAYFDSINELFTVTSVTKQGENLDITLNGPGHPEASGVFVFDGRRILVGQKAEIHASYFAQGKIVKIENAN